MKLLQELLLIQENIISMKDHLKNKNKKDDEEINKTLDRANELTDKGLIKTSKILTDKAFKKHLENKKKRQRYSTLIQNDLGQSSSKI